MKFKDFEKDAKQNVAESRGLTPSQLDEVLPAIGGALGKAIGAAASSVAKTAVGADQSTAQAGVQAAKTVGAAAVQGAQGVGKGLAQKVAQKNADTLAKAVLKKGFKLPVPTEGPGGKPEEFEIDDIKGDEVTLTNPKPKPGEPLKTVHKTKELDPIIQNLVKQNETK
jgi:hypothetical protein